MGLFMLFKNFVITDQELHEIAADKFKLGGKALI